MAKIILNNKNYEIDESSLATATNALKSHLSSTMSGAGASITLGGTAYNIDSTKLTTATNAFVSHLNTIAGNGAKVVVGGVEYGVDSTKIASAMSELGTAFGKLSGGVTPDEPQEERLEGDGAEFYTLAPTALSFRSTAPLNELQEVQINGATVDPSNYTLEEGSTIVTFPIDYLKTLNVGNYEVDVVSESKTVKGGFTVAAPELNEHGFYYNQPYMAYVAYYNENWVFFLRETGTLELVVLENGYMESCPYTMDGSNITVTNSAGNVFTGTFNENGLYCNEIATTFTIGNSEIVADEDYVYLYNSGSDVYYVGMVIDKTKTSYSTIRTDINGKPTRYIGQGAFLECVNLQNIVIPECIEYLEDGAFAYCSALKEITFENCMVQFMGAYVFQETPADIIRKHIDKDNNGYCDRCGENICEHLHTEIKGRTDEYSGDVVCSTCEKTVSYGGYYIPAGATYYKASTGETLTEGDIFPSFVSHNDIYNDGQCQYTYESRYYDKWSLTNANDMLVNYQVMESINGRKVGSIDLNAFIGCYSLRSITIPNGITSIGSLSGCTSLESIEVDENNQYYKDIDGNLYNKDGKTLIQYAAGKTATSFTIPDSVTSIDSSAFSYCRSLESVIIGNSVESIDDYAFRNCTSLASVTFEGTISQWNAITKSENWNYNVPATYVQCSDGQVSLV